MADLSIPEIFIHKSSTAMSTLGVLDRTECWHNDLPWITRIPLDIIVTFRFNDQRRLCVIPSNRFIWNQRYYHCTSQAPAAKWRFCPFFEGYSCTNIPQTVQSHISIWSLIKSALSLGCLNFCFRALPCKSITATGLLSRRNYDDRNSRQGTTRARRHLSRYLFRKGISNF